MDPNKYEYNLQSMSRDKTKSFWNWRSLVTSSIIISLSNNHNNINQAIAKCGASAIEKQHISNVVANPDIPGRSVLVNLVSEMNISPSRDQKFLNQHKNSFFLPDRILLLGEIAVEEVAVGEISDWGLGKLVLGKLVVGEIAVGEVVTGEIVLGKLRWGNDLTPV